MFGVMALRLFDIFAVIVLKKRTRKGLFCEVISRCVNN